MLKINKKEIVLVISALVLGLLGGYLFFNEGKTENLVNSLIENGGLENNKNLIVNESDIKTKQTKEDKLKEIKVYITGSVKNPGVYNMYEGDRIIDIFQKAGGESIGANLEQINMASHLKDGEKIYIPNLSEGENRGEQFANSFYDSEGKININTARQNELEKLTGIGPSKASSIIKHRKENGQFNSIKDLIKVSGIGEATLNNIEDEVCVK